MACWWHAGFYTVKILWISPFLLHPTNKGAQIRSLGTLRELHGKHEIHFATFQLPGQESGVARLPEYTSAAYRIPHVLPSRRSLAFVPQFLRNLVSDLPLTIERDVSRPMRALVERLVSEHRFDSIVCDFLTTAVNLGDLSRTVVFQHNVETVIWERMAEHATGSARKAYLRKQAARMEAFEKRVCNAARHVIAVSNIDAARMRERFGTTRVTATPTGVDLDYFARPAELPPVQHGGADLVFTGSMDWIPNVDGVQWFCAEVLPLIRARLPETRLAVVGRTPGPEILALAQNDPGIVVTGTVADIRPYLWHSRVAVVPLRIGGGTRLKIYEAMAAGIPQVSTTIGAEGLDYAPGSDIRIADTPEVFAAECVRLLSDAGAHARQSEAGWRLVSERFSWSHIAESFERILREA